MLGFLKVVLTFFTSVTGMVTTGLSIVAAVVGFALSQQQPSQQPQQSALQQPATGQRGSEPDALDQQSTAVRTDETVAPAVRRTDRPKPATPTANRAERAWTAEINDICKANSDVLRLAVDTRDPTAVAIAYEEFASEISALSPPGRYAQSSSVIVEDLQRAANFYSGNGSDTNQDVKDALNEATTTAHDFGAEAC